MLKNYLIIAWRNLKRSKAYSALNIVGLAVGLAVFILIMLFVRTEHELRPLSCQRQEHLPGGPGAAGQRLPRLQRLRRHARPAGRGHGSRTFPKS
ncbi:MAG: ABC transporter permease [Desulfobacterales bacterium]|nr:ABC transporter permease [Desulfobacterales bacterium]